MQFCTNLMRLRTKQEEPNTILAELDATSDKTMRPGHDFVRTWCYFGQNKKTRTRFCPNLVLLQTKRLDPAKILSEPDATSDKTRRTEHDFV